jgi:Bacterial cell division membrane protein
MNTIDNYMVLITIGFGGLFLFHLVINIGMTIGIFPVIGIPLPLISYGVSSLLSFMAMIGLALNTYKTRNQFI